MKVGDKAYLDGVLGQRANRRYRDIKRPPTKFFSSLIREELSNCRSLQGTRVTFSGTLKLRNSTGGFEKFQLVNSYVYSRSTSNAGFAALAAER